MKSKPLEVQVYHQLSELLKTLESLRESDEEIEIIVSTEGDISVNLIYDNGESAEGIAGGNVKDVVRLLAERFNLQ